MISPEQLRRYPFFAFLGPYQLRELAMIADELTVPDGETLFDIGAQADAMYFLAEGSIELHYVVQDEHDPDLRKDFMVGHINPGEVLGLSALIEPFQLTATAVTLEDCRVFKFDAPQLRRLCAQDEGMALAFQRQMAKTALDRLHSTRVQLAAATV